MTRGNNYNVMDLRPEIICRKYYGVTTMEKFARIKKFITLKNHHTLGCAVYVLDARLQYNIASLTKWEPYSCAGIYLGHSQLYPGSIAVVINPSTGHVSPQFHVVFYENFTTVPFLRKGTMTLNWTDLVKCSSQKGTPENIELKDTWLTPYLEEYPNRTPRYDPNIAPENKNQPKSKPYVQ